MCIVLNTNACRALEVQTVPIIVSKTGAITKDHLKDIKLLCTITAHHGDTPKEPVLLSVNNTIATNTWLQYQENNNNIIINYDSNQIKYTTGLCRYCCNSPVFRRIIQRALARDNLLTLSTILPKHSLRDCQSFSMIFRKHSWRWGNVVLYIWIHYWKLLTNCTCVPYIQYKLCDMSIYVKAQMILK